MNTGPKTRPSLCLSNGPAQKACPHHSTHRRLAETQAAMAPKRNTHSQVRWETGDASELSPDELDTFERCAWIKAQQIVEERGTDPILDTVSPSPCLESPPWLNQYRRSR